VGQVSAIDADTNAGPRYHIANDPDASSSTWVADLGSFRRPSSFKV
jgi:hypothetical protein